MTQLNITATAPRVQVKPVSASVGAGIFAASTLSPGDVVIAVENPMLVAMDAQRLGDSCYECYRREGDIPIELQLGFQPCPPLWTNREPGEIKLSFCAGCRSVKYCGKPCQRSSWRAHHALECPVFKGLPAKQLPNHIRAVLRLLLLRHAKRVAETDWDAFLECMPHMDSLNDVNEVAILEQMAKATRGLMPFDIDERLISEVLMRLKINSISLQTQYHEPIGLALHPLIAKINHSCDPNCYVRFPGLNDIPKGTNGASAGSILITPLRKIKAGQQITIPYVDQKIPLQFRRQELEERYFFTCTCDVCTKQEQAEAQLAHDLDPEKHYALRSIRNKAKRIHDSVTKKEHPISHEDRAKELAAQIRALFTYENDWDLGLYPFPQLLHQLTLTHIDSQNFALAFRYAALLHFKADPRVHAAAIHPMRLTHTLLVIRLAGVAIDNLPPTTSVAKPVFQRLSQEVDLSYWYQTLVEEFVTDASKTWKEQPWQWMNDLVKQQGLQSKLKSDAKSKAVFGGQQKRMDVLCSQILGSFKQA